MQIVTRKMNWQISCCVHLVLCCIIGLTEQKPINQSNKLKDCKRQKAVGIVELYVTVSSFSYVERNGTIVNRQLEINWSGRIPKPGDRIAFFDKDPSIKPFPEPIVEADPKDYPDGYFRTTVDFPYTYFNLTSLDKNPCLGYYAAYFTNDSLVSSACLQTRPFWMQKNKKYLKDLKLSEIMIPGSHDSGCFTAENVHASDTLTRYKYAQDEPIFNQLVYGIRYFDLRVGYYANTKEKYFINHSLFRTDHSVFTILEHVKSFLKVTQEIIILDFHLFPVGFDNIVTHFRLMKMIYKTLSPYLIPNDLSYQSAMMGELWSKGKRVLVAYNHKVRIHDPYGILWPGMPRAWGNKQHPEDLKKYFEGIFRKPAPEGLWASMAELTPNARFILTHPFKGLRVMADEINRNVTHWFRDEYWQKANIVATDYFLGNNIIDVAIQTNQRKSICIANLRKKHIS